LADASALRIGVDGNDGYRVRLYRSGVALGEIFIGVGTAHGQGGKGIDEFRLAPPPQGWFGEADEVGVTPWVGDGLYGVSYAVAEPRGERFNAR
jgi:hypothetical protein